MGNRGTTRSWDQDEIAKYGIFGHFANVTRGIRMRESIARRAWNEELSKLVALLHHKAALLWHKEAQQTARELCQSLKHETHLGGPCAKCLAASQTALELLYQDRG
jgi:hypothetical protein